MTEQQLLEAMVQAAREHRLNHGLVDEYVSALCLNLGLDLIHIPDSRRTRTAGWPDYVIIGKRILFREYKSPSDALSSAQQRRRYRILGAGGDWALWTALLVTNGYVERELKEIA